MKHWQDWRLYCTFSGDGTNGRTSICSICGSRHSRGVRTKHVKHDGQSYYRTEAINEYARRGESFRSLA